MPTSSAHRAALVVSKTKVRKSGSVTGSAAGSPGGAGPSAPQYSVGSEPGT
ncbi:MAG: hypothetical protein MZU95_03695 [Desulfomicrobium escambiense]|nr:hypothetical protein [Desulfomicrobium escambiense]